MRAIAVILCAAVLTPACAKDSGGGGEPGRLTVVTSLYPLTYVARRVAGDRATVVDLAPPGAEPHDIELTPAQVGRIEQADVVLVAAGVQPAVDDAAPEKALLDATAIAGGDDPHVWLDPVLLVQVATALAERLGSLDPGNAAAYDANTGTLSGDLAYVHDETKAGLARCERRDLVTSHAAFGRFAARYGLRQTGIAGVDPEAEPSPRRIADVAAFARRNGVTTVFAEAADDKTARTVAREAGAQVAVLDPVEVDRGTDYVTRMRHNLATLRDALGCR